MSGSDELVALAIVVGAHGVRGEVKVKVYNERSTLLAERETLWLRAPQAEPRQLRVAGRRATGKGLLLALSGCDDRGAAQALRGSELCVPREELPELQEGEYYLVDLVGLTAISTEGDELGKVQAILNYPTTDALAVVTADGIIEVPALEPYVSRVDVEAGRVVLGALDELEPPRPAKGRSNA